VEIVEGKQQGILPFLSLSENMHILYGYNRILVIYVILNSIEIY